MPGIFRCASPYPGKNPSDTSLEQNNTIGENKYQYFFLKMKKYFRVWTASGDYKSVKDAFTGGNEDGGLL